MGQLQVTVGVDQTGHDDAAGKLRHLPRTDSLEQLQRADGNDLPLFHGKGPSGNRRAFNGEKV